MNFMLMSPHCLDNMFFCFGSIPSDERLYFNGKCELRSMNFTPFIVNNEVFWVKKDENANGVVLFPNNEYFGKDMSVFGWIDSLSNLHDG